MKKNVNLMAFLIASILICSGWLHASDKKTIDKWADFFDPSVFSKAERIKELEWFAWAARNYQGMDIKSVGEDIRTHFWEAKVLSKAFYEITGIKVKQDIINEGEIVNLIYRQIRTNSKLYDIYINDSDWIGTHLRLDSALHFNKYMQGDGKEVTNPFLDLGDFLNLEFGQDYEGNQLQIPDQQFANLYWFRYDWFNRPEIKNAFYAKYGYELGVPLNWAAYEDIAEFFTGQTIDGNKVYGHMDYGKKSPSLGWRFTDAWLSIAGVGDKGLPNGLPVDEWGIRVENKCPVGASVERGGAVNGPAAVYALTTYIDWLKKYAPPFAASMTWSEAGSVPAQGAVAQRIFQYITWLSDESFTSPFSPVTDSNGKPLWRVAPTPHGKYWEEGMKVGYQDAGSWTILKKSVKGKDRAAAWLWAQFCISKTVSLKKFLIGKTPVRKSTVNSEYLAKREGDFGGIITFYKSTIENRWTDSGPNVPHYPLLAEHWAPNINRAVEGVFTPQQAMDSIARGMDSMMNKMRPRYYPPKLNAKKSRDYWLKQPGAPKPEKADEKPQTMPYEELIKAWK